MLSTASQIQPQIPRSSSDPIRVLHVIGAMEMAGIETWLMRILREIDRDRFRIDVLVHTTKPCAYDDEVRRLGSRIIACPYPQSFWSYGPKFKRILRQHGPYDIVHSHVHHYSGYLLRLARQAGVPIRIAHSHVDASVEEAKSSFLRRQYLSLMRTWIAKHATLGLSCSREAAADLFGAAWQRDPRWQILYCGIDLAPFQTAVNPQLVRAELGIPTDAFVIGHVGRFTEQKNHRFLVKIAAEVAARRPETYLLLVGKGELRPEIEQQVAQAGLADRTLFLGARADVPRLMRGAMDVFVLPSLYEGLPVVGLEAQAAQLPLVLSDCISPEVAMLPSIVRRVSLSEPTSVWVDAVLEAHQSFIQPELAQSMLESSPFNIACSVKALEKVYGDQ